MKFVLTNVFGKLLYRVKMHFLYVLQLADGYGTRFPPQVSHLGWSTCICLPVYTYTPYQEPSESD